MSARVRRWGAAAASASLLAVAGCGTTTSDITPGGDGPTTPATEVRQTPDGPLLSYRASGGILPQDTAMSVTRNGRVTVTKGLPQRITTVSELSQAQLGRLRKLAAQADFSGGCATEIYPEATVVTLTYAGRKIRCTAQLPLGARQLQRELERMAGPAIPPPGVRASPRSRR